MRLPGRAELLLSGCHVGLRLPEALHRFPFPSLPSPKDTPPAPLFPTAPVEAAAFRQRRRDSSNPTAKAHAVLEGSALFPRIPESQAFLWRVGAGCVPVGQNRSARLPADNKTPSTLLQAEDLHFLSTTDIRLSRSPLQPFTSSKLETGTPLPPIPISHNAFLPDPDNGTVQVVSRSRRSTLASRRSIASPVISHGVRAPECIFREAPLPEFESKPKAGRLI